MNKNELAKKKLEEIRKKPIEVASAFADTSKLLYGQDFEGLETEDLNEVASFLVPFYDSGVNISNITREYIKPEEKRDYEYIKNQFKEAGQSAAIETGLLLLGGVAAKYGAKGIKSLYNKVKQYEIDPTAMSAFGAGAIRKKPTIKEGVPTIEAAGLTDEAIDAWRSKKETPKEFRDSLKGRNPELQAQAKRLGIAQEFEQGVGGRVASGISNVVRDTYRKLADELRPIRKVNKVPKPATNKEIVSALNSRQRTSPIIGLNDVIPEKDIVDVRLNIPAYTDYDVWVPTITHNKKEKYKAAVRIQNVKFIQPDSSGVRKAQRVAQGGEKNPFAVMTGEYVDGTDDELFTMAKEVFDSSDWTQVGYDPIKRGFFYDRETGQAILEADEVIQVGHLVLAKNAKKTDPDVFPFNKGGAIMDDQMKMAFMQEGGMVDEGGQVEEESGNEVPIGALKEEVADDVPAMVSEGEFVFPADVVRYIGLEKLMQLRQEAKIGLKRMEAMGQMGNSDEATMPDDLPFGEADIVIMGSAESPPQEMYQGGVVQAANGGMMNYQPPSGILGYQPSVYQGQQSTGQYVAPASSVASTPQNITSAYKPLFLNQTAATDNSHVVNTAATTTGSTSFVPTVTDSYTTALYKDPVTQEEKAIRVIKTFNADGSATEQPVESQYVGWTKVDTTKKDTTTDETTSNVVSQSALDDLEKINEMSKGKDKTLIEQLKINKERRQAITGDYEDKSIQSIIDKGDSEKAAEMYQQTLALQSVFPFVGKFFTKSQLNKLEEAFPELKKLSKDKNFLDNIKSLGQIVKKDLEEKLNMLKGDDKILNFKDMKFSKEADRDLTEQIKELSLEDKLKSPSGTLFDNPEIRRQVQLAQDRDTVLKKKMPKKGDENYKQKMAEYRVASQRVDQASKGSNREQREINKLAKLKGLLSKTTNETDRSAVRQQVEDLELKIKDPAAYKYAMRARKKIAAKET